MPTPTPTIEAAQEPLKVVLERMTPGVFMGGVLAMFPSPDGGYVRLSDHEASIRAKDAEIDALKADAGRYCWLRERHWFDSDLCVLREPKRVLTRSIGLGADCPSGDRLDAAIDAIKGDANAD